VRRELLWTATLAICELQRRCVVYVLFDTGFGRFRRAYSRADDLRGMDDRFRACGPRGGRTAYRRWSESIFCAVESDELVLAQNALVRRARSNQAKARKSDDEDEQIGEAGLAEDQKGARSVVDV